MKHRVQIEKIPFGKTAMGEKVSLYRLVNQRGAYIDICDYGCAIIGMHVFERSGKARNVLSRPPADQWSESLSDCTVRLVGASCEKLSKVCWQASEGEDTSLILQTTAQEGDSSFRAKVSFRMKDFERMVIDYVLETDGNAYLTHQVGFCLDDNAVLQTHKLRVFTREELLNGVPCPMNDPAVSAMEYLPLPAADRTFVRQDEHIHPFAEIVSTATDLALTAYSTMPAMALLHKERGGVDFIAGCPIPLPCRKISRTVYGIDLLYHPEQGSVGNPLMFFPR